MWHNTTASIEEENSFSSPKAFWVVPCGLAALKVTEPMDHDFDANFDKAVLKHQ